MEDLMQKVREGRGTDAACMLDYCTQIEEDVYKRQGIIREFVDDR